jgi:hypothetical protein
MMVCSALKYLPLLLKFETVNELRSPISGISKESHFRTSDRRKKGPHYYIVEWDVTLAIKHNEMIWRVILRPDKRPKIPLETTTLRLDAVESKNKILGSLASRWVKGPVKPTSQFPSPPMFSRKRALEDGQGSRKSTRIAVRRSDVPIPSIESRITEETEDTSSIPSSSGSNWVTQTQLSGP